MHCEMSSSLHQTHIYAITALKYTTQLGLHNRHYCNAKIGKGGKRMRGRPVTDQIEYTQASHTNNSLCIGYLTTWAESSIDNYQPPTHKSTTCTLRPLGYFVTE